MIFVDSNVPMYLIGAPHPHKQDAQRLLETAIASLDAGADLLLVGGGPHLDALCDGIAAATRSRQLAPDRLAEAAARVRKLAAGA